MGEFKKGQKVRVAFARPGYMAQEGEILTITRASLDSDGDMAGENAQGAWRYVSPEQVELVSEGPQWSDVEPGDTIVIRVKKTGEEVTTKAYAHLDFISGVGVLAFGRDSADFQDKFELVKVEKAKPQPPTTPGSHVVIKRPSHGPNHLFLTERGNWMSQTGRAYWTAQDVADAEDGFTVIHDAGKDS